MVGEHETKQFNYSDNLENYCEAKYEGSNALVPTKIPIKHTIDSNFDNLNVKLESMLEKLDGIWTYKICGKAGSLNNRNQKHDF